MSHGRIIGITTNEYDRDWKLSTEDIPETFVPWKADYVIEDENVQESLYNFVHWIDDVTWQRDEDGNIVSFNFMRNGYKRFAKRVRQGVWEDFEDCYKKALMTRNDFNLGKFSDHLKWLAENYATGNSNYYVYDPRYPGSVFSVLDYFDNEFYNGETSKKTFYLIGSLDIHV